MISGVVTDIHGSPIANAIVYWTYAETTTGPTGAFSIPVWTSSRVDLTAERDRYAHQTLSNNAPSITWAPRFSLRYALIAVSYLTATNNNPARFNNAPAKTLSFHAYSTAPSVGTAVRVQLPTGMLTLVFDGSYTSPEGWSKWKGTWTVPLTTLDGNHSFTVCASNAGGGTCDAPSGLTLAMGTGQYIVDSAGPTLSAMIPTPNHNTLARRPVISIQAVDPLAGLDPVSSIVKVDGNMMSSTFSGTESTGTVSYTPSTDLSLGVHSISATVADLAGNSTTASWSINVMSLTAGSASTGSIEETISVPVGAETISFPDVPLTLGAYDVSLSSLAYTGYGPMSRTVDGSGAEVAFSNTSGSSVPQVVSLGSSTFTQNLGVLFAETGVTKAHFPAQTMIVSSPSIPVPGAYRVTGSTATLRLPSRAAGPITTPTLDPTINEIPDGRSVIFVGTSFASQVQRSQTAISVTTSAPTATVYAQLPGAEPVRVPIHDMAAPLAGDIGYLYGDTPVRVCGSPPPNKGCFWIGADPDSEALSKTEAYLNLGEGAVRLYSTHWLYRRSDAAVYIDWQQSSGDVDESVAMPCINGGQRRLKLTRFTNESRQALRVAGPWTHGPVAVPSNGGQYGTAKLSWADGSNSLSQDAYHSSGSYYSGNSDAADVTVGVWEIAAGSADIEQLATGTEWSTSSNDVMSLLQMHEWKIFYDKICS